MQLAMERMKGSHIAVVCPYANVGKHGLFFKRQIPGETDMHGFVIEDGPTFMTTNMTEVKTCTRRVFSCTNQNSKKGKGPARAYRPWMVLCRIGFDQKKHGAGENVWLDLGDVVLIDELISESPTQPI